MDTVNNVTVDQTTDTNPANGQVLGSMSGKLDTTVRKFRQLGEENHAIRPICRTHAARKLKQRSRINLKALENSVLGDWHGFCIGNSK